LYAQIDGQYSTESIASGQDAIDSLADVQGSLGITDLASQLSLGGSYSVGDTTFYRLSQNVDGVTVYGRDVVVVSVDGQAAGLTSNYMPLDGLDTTLRISEGDATRSAITYFSSKYKIDVAEVDARMLGPQVYSSGSMTPQVTYMVQVSGVSSDMGYLSETVFVANNRKIVGNVNDVRYDTVPVPGTQIDADLENGQFAMKNSITRVQVWQPVNPNVFDPTNPNHYKQITWPQAGPVPDDDAVAAMKNASDTHDFYSQFGVSFRKGIDVFGNDDKGFVNIVVGVNIVSNKDYARCHDVANCGSFFTPSGDGSHLIISDGSTPTHVAELDVLAHEYTHGIVFDTANFTSDPQPGAINEAFADIFGELVENSVTGHMDWIHGSRNIATPSGNNISSLSDYPAHTEVHDASTLISHTAYLMWMGGPNGDWTPINDVKTMAKLWYQALNLMHSDASFEQCRNAVEMSARIMVANAASNGGLTQAQYDTVRNAFEEVGIGTAAYQYDQNAQNPFDIEVIGADGNAVSSYHLTITRLIDYGTLQNGRASVFIKPEQIRDVQVDGGAYQGVSLDDGVYALTVSETGKTPVTIRIVVRSFLNNATHKVVIQTDFLVQTPRPVPTLGRVWASNQVGYGDVKPPIVYNGGDPTGYVDNISWSSWGGSTATGSGSSTYVGPTQIVAEGTVEDTTIVAFDLGDCSGQWMYKAIEWYFPQHGETFDPRYYIDICTGDYVSLDSGGANPNDSTGQNNQSTEGISGCPLDMHIPDRVDASMVCAGSVVSTIILPSFNLPRDLFGGDPATAHGFKSPSGNLACALGDDYSTVLCTAVITVPLPSDPRNADCDTGQDSLWVGDNGSGVACYGDVHIVDVITNNSSAPVLQYGQTIISTDYPELAYGDPVACHSAEDGVTCWNTITHHGIKMSKSLAVYW